MNRNWLRTKKKEKEREKNKQMNKKQMVRHELTISTQPEISAEREEERKREKPTINISQRTLRIGDPDKRNRDKVRLG